MGTLYKINSEAEEFELIKKHNYVVCKRSLKRGELCHPHWHDYFEMELILSGQITHHLNGTTYKIGRGCGYLLCSTDLHHLSCDTDAELVNLRFTERLLPKELNDLILGQGGIYCRFEENELQYILSRIDRLGSETADNKSFATQVITNIISEIIYIFLRGFKDENPVRFPSTVQRAITYMLRNFRQDISLYSVAKEISVTPKYLGSVFKQSTGLSFHEYLNDLRLKYVTSLLLSSDASVKEIAFLSGYNSVEHFLYTFKKRFSITPTQYRKLNR